MTAEPIFIVGVQRSGTTLLAAMLAAHSRMSCGPETHFFRRLAEIDAAALIEPARWPYAAVDFVRSIDHNGVEPGTRKFLLEKYSLTPDRVREFLDARSPSVAGVLASVTEPYMVTRGKQRWVEKTPDHLLHLNRIREYFPESPVIHLVRDPRDVALSLLDVPWGVSSLLEGLLYWRRMEGAARTFVTSDNRCCTVRFEDLVRRPAEALTRICAFVGESFEPRMLDTSRTGREINARNAPWKQKVSEAIDPRRVEAWRSRLSPGENQLAEAVVGDQLGFFAYARQASFTGFAEVLPCAEAAASHAGALQALAGQGLRFWREAPDEQSQATVYVGEPGDAAWQQAQLGVMKLAAAAARAAVTGSRRLYWISGGERGWAGYRNLVSRACLRRYRYVTAHVRSSS